VLGPQGKPQAVSVRVGIGDGTVTELVGGELKPGQEVIVGGGPKPAQATAAAGGTPFRFGF
jgi:HlyD family secretion protein